MREENRKIIDYEKDIPTGLLVEFLMNGTIPEEKRTAAKAQENLFLLAAWNKVKELIRR
jgi:hypothetical protein